MIGVSYVGIFKLSYGELGNNDRNALAVSWKYILSYLQVPTYFFFWTSDKSIKHVH